MEKRFFKMVVIVILAAVVLTACGKTAGEKENNTAKGVGKDAQTDESEKTVITYGVIVPDGRIRLMINEFNHANPDYEIVLKEYAKKEEDGNIRLNEQMAEDLALDILNGTGPDILDLSFYFSMDQYVQKGVLEDLYPYIDGDEELSREDFLPNILKAYETDGKLYGIPIAFSIDTIVGPSSLLGDRNSWTLDEMIAFTEQFEPGTDIFWDSSQSNVIRFCLKTNYDQFVSWEENTFVFNRELYKKILEFANRFPKDADYVENKRYQERIGEKDMFLRDLYMHTLEYDQVCSSLFREPVTYIGYPIEEGNGSLILPHAGIGINAQSPNKEGAWEFIRLLLSNKYYDEARPGSVIGFCTRKDALQQQLYRSEWRDGGITFIVGEDFEYETKSFKNEEIERVRALIESLDTLESSDYTILKILTEEAQAYFAGVKSADQVADIAESRIKMYVNEMK